LKFKIEFVFVVRNIGVVPDSVSQGVGGFFKSAVASDGVGTPVAVEAVGYVFLSTQSDVCMSDIVLQVISPWLSGVVSSAFIEGAPVSSSRPRAA